MCGSFQCSNAVMYAMINKGILVIEYVDNPQL